MSEPLCLNIEFSVSSFYIFPSAVFLFEETLPLTFALFSSSFLSIKDGLMRV